MTVYQSIDQEDLINGIVSNGSSRSAILVRQRTIENLFQTVMYKVLRQNFIVAIRGFRFPQYHILFASFNKKIKQIFEAGLLQHWHRFLMKVKAHDTGPTALTVDVLSTGFQVWICFLIVAIFGFCLELVLFNRGRFFELIFSIYRFFIFRSIIIAFPCN